MKLSTASLTKTCRLLSEQFRGLKLKQSTQARENKQTNKQQLSIKTSAAIDDGTSDTLNFPCGLLWGESYIELPMWFGVG